MSCMNMVPHKRSKVQCPVRCSFGTRGRVPYFDESTYADREIPARGGKGNGRDSGFERQVIEDNATMQMGEDRAAIFVNSEKKITSRVQCQAGNVTAVGQR